jgi:hypothetical protein
MSDTPAVHAPSETVPSPAPARSRAPAAPALDDERTWLGPLASTGTEHNRAVAELHRLLLRASTFEVRRRGAACGLAAGP